MQRIKDSMIRHMQSRDPNLSSSYLNHETLWDISDSVDKLTFIDFIKGFVPGFISDRLFMFFKNRHVLEFLFTFYDELFDLINLLIWRPRCVSMIELEKLHNIYKNRYF